MRGTSCADLAVEAFATIEALPPQARSLIDGARDVFATVPWWRTVLAHAKSPGSTAVFVVVRRGDDVVAVLPMRRSGARLGSLTTPYTCVYCPLVAPGVAHPVRVAAMAAFARFCRRNGVVRLDALPVDGEAIRDLEAGSRQAGLVVLRFDHFGNWFEDVEGLGWLAYLALRPGALRETIRRRLRRAEKVPDARFALLTGPDQMARAAIAFESVYARSWKEAEPYPEFNVALMHAIAACGWLRLGVWSIGSVPVAVQLWVVKGGNAIVLKLAHDEAYRAHSPGTVLTALMVRHLLDNEHVARIDFGRGDDDYKEGWAGRRRQRIGLLLVNPWHLAGMATLLRHAVGRIRRRLQLRGRAAPTDACHGQQAHADQSD
jgi:CelD/BcsL family acetyltransferase involved in cellulose biosynthesis